MEEYQAQVSDRSLLLIDKLMQLLADALIRFRSLKHESIEGLEAAEQRPRS